MILPEIDIIGIYNSRIAEKKVAVSKDRKTFMFEIELPVEDGGIAYIENESAQITKNLVICAKPGQKRHTRFPFKCYYIHMAVRDEFLFDMLINLPDFIDMEKSDKVREIFKKLVKKYKSFNENDEIIIQSLILELIYILNEHSGRRGKNSALRNKSVLSIEKALRYIDENLTEELSLENVAKTVPLSPIHFHNLFKKLVGKTLREYVEEKRIKKAIEHFETTDKTLTQISYECGFSSQSYFSYVFKRKIGRTPRNYMKDMYDRYEK